MITPQGFEVEKNKRPYGNYQSVVRWRSNIVYHVCYSVTITKELVVCFPGVQDGMPYAPISLHPEYNRMETFLPSCYTVINRSGGAKK